MATFTGNLENMNTYTMAQVETLTGIKSHTLRIWERRYTFLKPERTETNIRYYSDADVRKLLNISILINNGYRVSKIDKMNEDEVHEVVVHLNSRSSAKFDDDLNRLVYAMIEMNEESFNHIFKRHVTRNGLLSTVIDLLYPFLDHVGVLWTTNRTIPAQEHFISCLIRQKIVSAIDMIPPPKEDAKSVILFLPENESHEIALLLANYIARDLGFKVYYLGQNVPLENILEVNEIAKASIILTMFIAPITENYRISFIDLFKNFDIPLYIGGNFDMTNVPAHFEKLESPAMLADNLKIIRNI
ncbi:MerR family transcriptional regulator [Urechidicola sp. KH5]